MASAEGIASFIAMAGDGTLGKADKKSAAKAPSVKIGPLLKSMDLSLLAHVAWCVVACVFAFVFV